MEKQIRNYLKILETSPDNVPAFDMLAKIYQEHERWGELAGLIMDKAQRTAHADKVPELFFKAAEIFAERLAKFDRVEECYQKILERDPLNAKALSLLKTRYRESHQWAELIHLFEREAEHAETPERRADALTEIAALWDRELNNEEKKVHYLTLAQDAANHHLPSLRQLKTHYLKSYRVDRAVELIEREEKLLESEEQRGELYLEVGMVLAEDPFEKDRAIAFLDKALKIKGRSKDAQKKLDELTSMDNKWQKLVKKYKDEAVNASDKREASAIYLKVAGIVFLYAPDDAEEILSGIEKALILDPGNRRALLLGERYLGGRGDWPRLSEFYAGVYETTRDENLKVEAMAKAGTLHLDRLNYPEKALLLYRDVLKLNPDHGEAFRRLSGQLVAAGDWDSLKELLADRLERCHEVTAKVETHLELARLAAEHEDDPTKAITHLEHVLDLAPGHLDASRRLLPLYQQTGAFERLVNVYALIIPAADDAEKHGLELGFAELLRGPLNKPKDAYKHYGNAFLADPEHEEGRKLLEDLTLELEWWEELVRLYKKVLKRSEPPANGRALKFRLGQIYDRELSQYEEAESCYRELCETQADPETLDALARLYMKDLRWEDMAAVLTKKAELARDAEEKRDILMEQARILDMEIKDRARAVKVYYRVVELAPKDLEALSRLEELLEQAEAWEELAVVLERELGVITSIPEKVHLNFKLGNLYNTRLSRRDAAAHAFLAVLTLDPSHLPAIESLEELLNQGVQVIEIFRGLEEHYRKLEKWNKLATGYEALIRSEQDETQVGLLCAKLAEINLVHRSMPQDAFEWVKKGLKTPYLDAAFFHLALDCARRLGKQPELLQALEEKSQGVTDDDRKLKLELALGALYWDSMQDAEQAESHYRAAVALRPGDPDVLEKAAAFFEATRQWEAQAEHALRLAEALPEPARRKDVLLGVAKVLDRELKRNDEAQAALRRVLDLLPGDMDALNALFALQEAAGAWDDAALTLGEKLERLTEAPALIEAKHQLARIYREKLDDFEEAARLYGEILVLDPQNDAAIGALERFLDEGKAERLGAATLRPIYEERGAFAKLVRVLALQHGGAEGADAYQLAVRAASIHEDELNDHASALEWYGKALLSARDAALLKELKQNATATGMWARFVEILDLRLAQELAPAERVELLFAAAEALRGPLAEGEAAGLRYAAILEIEPMNERAVDALTILAREAGDDLRLAQYLERKREAAAEKNVRREVTLELAELSERLGRVDAAVGLLHELLSERENDPPVLDRLESILSLHERHEELYLLLEKRLKYLREDEDILPVRIRVATLLEEKLGRHDDAMTINLELMHNYGNHPAVLALADRLMDREATQLAIANEMEQKFLKSQDWPRLVKVYEIQVRAAGAAEKAKLLTKLSAIYRDKLQDPQKAFDGFARLFVSDPGNVAALAELEKLSGELGAWRELAEVYERAGEECPDHTEAAGLYIKAARLYEDILAFQEDAIRAYRRVLNRDRNNMTAIQALEGLCRKTERWEELREIYLQRIGLTADVGEKKELYVNICILFEHQLGDPLGTTPYYEAILELTPADAEVVDRLMGLYTVTEAWAKKAGLLAHKMELTDSLKERNALKLEKAAIHEEKLAEFAEAKDLYKAVLTADEDNDAALGKLEEYVLRDEFQDELARFLEPVYRRKGSWERVIVMQEYQFAHSADADEQLQLLRLMAATYEQRLENRDKAYATMARAFVLRPADGFVQEELERLAGELGKFEDLCGLYLERITEPKLSDLTEIRVNLLLVLARLTEHYLKEVETAAEHYRSVLELSDNLPEALHNLERIYAMQRKWPQLIDVLERKTAITPDLEGKKTLLFQICNIHEDELSDNKSAIATYRRMLELDGADRDVLKALVRLTTSESQWEDLVEVRRRQLGISAGVEESWELRHAIAMVLWKKLARTEEAIEIFRGVLDENHHHTPCREAMEGLLLEDASELAAARILEPLYREDSQWDELIDTLDIQAAYAETADAKRDFFLHMAGLAEREVGNPSRAFSHTVRAFENDPVNPSIREGLERLALESNRWADLADAYRAEANRAAEVPAQVDLFLNAGRVTLRELDDPHAAKADYGAARERDQANREALDALEEIFERIGAWRELNDVFYTKVELESGNEAKIALLCRAAKVEEEKLSDAEAAVRAHLRALERDAAYMPSLMELDRLYEKLCRFDDLRGILERRIALTGDAAARHELAFRMGRVIEEKLMDRPAALAVYESILRENNEHPDALRALERLVGDTEMQDASLAVLTPLFEEKGWWERLADVLEVKLSTLADRAARVATMNRVKDIFEAQLHDAAKAFDVACRLFKEDFTDLGARQEVERLAVVTGGFEGLVATYRSFHEQVSDRALKVEIMTKIARIQEEQLQNLEAAVDSYRAVLDAEARNFTAMLALDRLYERLERYADLVELIPREFELYDDPKEVVEQRLRLGHLWEEKLQDKLTAIDMYKKAAEEQPDNAVALSALERIYESEGFWEELLEIYKSQVRIARGDTKKARLYAKMAQVLFEKLDRAREAIPLWSRVLQFDEANLEVMDKLEELYAHESMWDDLVNHLRKRMRLARTQQERAGITKRMARVTRDHLGQEDQATQLFLKVLETTPDDMDVIDTLEEIYLKNQSWKELVQLLTRLLPQVSGPELRSLLLRLASIQVERLANPGEGEDLARRVLSLDPAPEELVRLEKLFRETGAWGLYLEILARQADKAPDAETLVALQFRMADIWTGKVHDSLKARSCLERVLEVQPGNLQAAELLEPLYRDAAMWPNVITMLGIRLNESGSEAELAGLHRQIADIYEEKLNDASGAFTNLAEVFRLEPSDEALLARLDRLAEQAGRHLDETHLIREVIPTVSADPKLHRGLMLKVAKLYEEKAANADLAAEYYKMFLEAGEYNDHAVQYLVVHYETIGDWEELVRAYQIKIPFMNQEEKVEVGCRVASIFDERLNQSLRAVKTYQQVMKMDPGCMTANEALIRIYRREEKYQELVERLRHKLHLVSDPADINDVRLTIARICLDKLDDLTQAKTFYRAVVADDPRNLEALGQLEVIYGAEENYDELLEVLSRRVNVVETDEEKLAIYKQMAGIWESKFGQRDMAVSYLEKMLAIKPDHMEAMAAVERIYRESSDWPMLAATYQRHIDQTIEAEEIVRLYTEMGRIHGEYLFQPAKAIEFFNKALKIDETNLGVLQALADLYASHEKWNEAIQTLERISTLAGDKSRRVEALSRLGHIFLVNLGDRERAKQVFDRMVAEDPTYVPALRALRQYYAAVEDWPAFLKTVEREKRHVTDPKEKADALFEEGRYYHEKEGDVDRALLLYRESANLAPDFLPVLQVLGRIFFERQQWNEAREALSRTLDIAAQLSDGEQAEAHFKLAFIAERSGDDAEALTHYTASYKLNSGVLATLEGLARMLYKREDWDRAFRVYQTILVRFREEKSVPELVELFCRLGEVNGQLGKHDTAVRMYEKALELDPESVRALKAIVFFYESLENWKKVLQFRYRLIKRLEGEDLFEQWRRVGDVFADRMNDSEKGLEAYRRALEIKATDVELITKVADLLLANAQFADAIGVLKSAAAIVTEPERALEMNLRLAELVREHGESHDEYINYYNAALDLRPDRLDIFALIERTLTEWQDWDKLDLSYRLMIARLPKDEMKTRIALWKKLGMLLADKSGNLNDAIKAWEAVAALEPENLGTLEHLAGLYARSAEHVGKAIAIHRELIERDPRRTGSYEALFAIHNQPGHQDKALCFASAARLLGRSEGPAAAFYRENLPEVKVGAINMLDRQLFGTLLLHPDARHNVGQVLNILFHHVDELMPSDLRKEGLKKKDKVDLEQQPYTFCTYLLTILKTMGLPEPEVYLKPGMPTGVRTAAVQPATLIVGEDAFERFPKRDLLFLLAKNAVLVRPDFVTALMLPAEQVRGLLDATAQLYEPNFPAQTNPVMLKEMKKRIDRGVPRKLREMLGGFSAEYTRVAAGFDVEAWQRGLLLTAHRAGLLFANDLALAVETLRKHPGDLTQGEMDAILADLMSFSVSEAYFHLRSYLGFNLS